MPSNAERGGRAAQNVKTSSMPSRSGARLDEAGGEDALDLAREDDAAVGQQRVVQRAHAEAVAHQRERARRAGRGGRSPTGRCSACERGRAVAVEQAQQDLGVARRAEALALGLELLAQLVVVEDLAVVDHHGVAVGALHRLPARRDVEDREPRRDEPGAAAGGDAVAVGAAVADRARHAAQRRLVDRRAPGRRAGCPRCRTRQRPAGWFDPSMSMMRALECRYAVAVRTRRTSS